MAKARIGFRLPERHKPTRAEFSIKPAHVELWLEQLPTGNLGETTHQIYDLLNHVNALDLPWRDRLHFLEQLSPTIELVQSGLQKHYIGMGFPLPPRTQKVADLSLSLYVELSLGYKIAIEDMFQGGFLQFSKGRLREMVHRAMRYTGRALLTTYQAYTTPPENCWFELHLLYLHAEERGLHRDVITDIDGELTIKSSISRLYKQILLLALASPYRLRQGEAAAIFRALATWAAYAELIPHNHADRKRAIFALHMDSDHPPDYRAYISRSCDNELCRLIATQPLIRELQNQIKAMKTASEGETPASIEGLSLNLIERLTLAWGHSPKRQYQRNWRESSLEVVIGLTAVHQTLSAESGVTDSAIHRSHYHSHTVPTASKGSGGDVWNVFAARESGRGDEDLVAKDETTALPQHHTWIVNNESAGGYHLTTPSEPASKVHVGELLAVRPNSDSRWELAMVRWVHQIEERALELGVQVLAPEAIPVMVKKWEKRHTDSEPQRALLLPPLKSAGVEASLITPVRLFVEGQRLQVESATKQLSLYLCKILLDGGTFIQYSYTQQVRKTLHPHGEDGYGDDSPFANLWSEL